MLERMLSEAARRVWIALSLVGICIVAYLLLTGNPAVDWYVELLPAKSNGHVSLKLALLIAALTIAIAAFIPAYIYDKISGN